MNETSQTTSSGANGSAVSVPGVRALQHGHARVVAQPRVQLAVADVDRDHARGAALEQAVGEAAGRGADVERSRARRVDAERLERVRELLAAARDEPRRPLDHELDVVGDLRARLVVARARAPRSRAPAPGCASPRAPARPARRRGACAFRHCRVMEVVEERFTFARHRRQRSCGPGARRHDRRGAVRTRRVHALLGARSGRPASSSPATSPRLDVAAPRRPRARLRRSGSRRSSQRSAARG